MRAIGHAARMAADALSDISGNSVDVRTLIARSERALMHSQDGAIFFERIAEELACFGHVS